MKKIFYYIGILILIISVSCERNEPTPDQFFSATINGEKFQASYLYALRQFNENTKSIELFASNLDILDSLFSYGDIENNDDFKLFLFSFHQDCIAEKLFTWDDINADTTSVGVIYEFYDTYLKAITPQSRYSDGFIEIESIDFDKNGVISGNFEIGGRNYNELDFTDTIIVKDGKFKLKFNN